MVTFCVDFEEADLLRQCLHLEGIKIKDEPLGAGVSALIIKRTFYLRVQVG